MPYNLLTTPWLPVRRADGAHDTVAPWQIAETDNPVIALEARRPDFNGALAQFLIGLLQTAFAPEDDDQWFDRFEQPPEPAELRAAFDHFSAAFNLDGDGPRFMQDLDVLEGQKPLPITALLIDTAGSSTHFVKALPEGGISPAQAAMALYTLQTNAPSGGAGHRTSLRGGGPLTTLVLYAPERGEGPAPTLWRTLWLNVLNRSAFDHTRNRPDDIFPWLRPTRVSDKSGAPTTPLEVSPLQMFWGMPRRIRLDFTSTAGRCGLSDEQAPALVTNYRTRNYGTNYPSETWEHTLSPYTHDGKQWLPLHPHGAINYRHWLGLVQPAQDKKLQRRPAGVVRDFYRRRLHREGLRFALWAFGYEMDNMKPICWHEATYPLFHLDDPKTRENLEKSAESLVRAAGEVANNLRGCLKDAWFQRNDPRHKGADTGFVDTAFWQESERCFYDLVHEAAGAPCDQALRKALYQRWHHYLLRLSEKLFDRWTNMAHLPEQSHIKRIVAARRDLGRFNHKKSIKDLLELPADKSAAPHAIPA